MKNITRQRTFTLIELLVVIAIIAILAAMLMPALSKAREAAKASNCVSNLKSVMLATFQYTDANRGHIPTYVCGGEIQAENPYNHALINLLMWFELLPRGSSIGHCPSIGGALVLVHLLGISFTGTSVNPARSFGPALIAGDLSGIWVFLLAPLVGGALAAVVYRFLDPEKKD